MKPSDWYALQAEADEPTLTRAEALERPQDRPAPSRPAPSLMRSLRLPDKRSRAWMQQAACRGMSAALFFPDDHDLQTRRHAIEVCESCPVFTECDDYANGIQDGVTVTFREYGGVWAGRLRGRGSKSDKPRLAVCSECDRAFTPARRDGAMPKTCSAECSKARRDRTKAKKRKEAS